MNTRSKAATMKPIDLTFLLMERPNRPMHMCALMVFDIPKGANRSFVRGVVRAFRGSAVGAPFNQRLRWTGTSKAVLEVVEIEPEYHIRHLAVPAPGTMSNCMEMVAGLNMPLLDRSRPLWECNVIEGLRGNRFAVMLKLHHAIADGETGLKMLRRALTDSGDDAEIRAFWAPAPDKKKSRLRRPVSNKQAAAILSQFRSLPASLGKLAKSLDSETPNDSDRAQAFAAPKTIFNNAAETAARRYGNCELPLTEVKAIAHATDSTVNDVVMTMVDAAMHRYCAEIDTPLAEPLVAMMAMSLRTPGDDSGGNKAGVQLVRMGEPAANRKVRLAQIKAATGAVKAAGSRTPAALLNLHSLLLTGSAAVADRVPSLARYPSSNLVISNMVGPREKLYLGGAPMVAFHGLPILPPAGGLNVTFASVTGVLGVAIAAAPEAVSDPALLARLVVQEFNAMKKIAGQTGVIE